MNRYNPELFSDLRKSTTKFENVKPLKLNLVQFYTFMVQRRLNKTKLKIPRASPRPLILFDLLDTEDTNPLYVYIHSNIAYLPDVNVTWSISKYESN